MNILYCGDINTRKGIALSIISLTANVTTPLHIYIMTMSLGVPANYKVEGRKFPLEKALDRKSATRVAHDILPIDGAFASYMDAYVKKVNAESSVQLIDATEVFLSDIPEANMDTRFTPCCMLRLYADLIVPALPDKLLYLDYDVLCRKNFTAYYYTDISRYEYAASLDYYGKWFYSKLKHKYINSGVLLMNMEKMRQTGFLAKCREICRTQRLFLPDQHALNMCWKKRKIVSRLYNSQKKVYKKTVFQHFSTTLHILPPGTISVKPWEREKLHEILHIYEYDPMLDALDIIIKDLNL